MSRSSRPSRARALLLGLLAAAALATSVWAVGATQQAPPPAAHDAGPPSIAFLGDSLTVGVGAPPGRGYAPQTAELLAWPVAVVDGVSGSGYLTAGQGRPMPARAGEVIATQPDVVVVAGGSNDTFGGLPADAVGEAAGTLFAELRDGLPDATVVVLGPFPGSFEHVGQPDPVRDALQAAADQEGVEFVDPRELLAETFADPDAWRDYISADGLHPNEEGYAVLAEALAGRLRELVR